MPDDQYTGDGGLGFDYEDVPQAVAPPPATFGYMYGSSRYANEPPVPRPTQAQLEALPANTLTDIPTGGWAYRETVPHQERLMQLDREAQRARQAAEAAAQDAQMFAQMSRVARSMKDIEVARREVNFGIAQRRIANGEAPHQVFASMPGLFGSGAGYAAAVNATRPTPAPTIVPPSGSTPGYIQDPRGVPHFFPGSGQQPPHKLGEVIPVKDPVTGEVIANVIATGPQTGHVQKPEGLNLTAPQQVQVNRARISAITAQLANVNIADKKERDKFIAEKTAELNDISKSLATMQEIKVPKKFQDQPLTKQQAIDFLKQASGDKEKARKLARDAGFSF